MKHLLLLPLLAINALTTACNPDMSSPKARHTALKTVLRNGIKECIARDLDNQTTKFNDAPSFSQTTRSSRFMIQPIDPNSCFKAKATLKNNLEIWYQIDFNIMTNKVSKTCGDPSKLGCDEGNTW